MATASGETRSMGRQRILATVQRLRQNETLGGALLVFLGTLFLLLSFTFYPLFIIPFLAAAAGALAYRKPPLGTILGMFLAFPAVAYQAPVLAWLFSLALAITLFEAFEHWSAISFLEMAILAPFAPFPFSLFSGFIFLALAIAAFRYGSAHSFAVSLPAIFVVLLLSTIWLQPTASFITISNDYNSLYGPAMEQLQNNAKPAVDLVELVPAAGNAIMSLADFSTSIMPVTDALGKIVSNLFTLLSRDFAVIQLAAWALALFLCAFLPAQFSHRYKQSISALSLFIIPLTNLLVAPAFDNPVEPLSFIYCGLSVGAIALLENFGMSLSREKQVNRKEKQKAFGKFGLADLGDSEGVDSLDDVGGYADVKGELREAIIAPIKQKELAYTYGIKPPNGILLFGPPGTGKTLLMKALAKEMDVGFYYVKCSDLLSEWYGESLPYGEKILVEEGGTIKLEKIGDIVEQKRKVKVLSFNAQGAAAFSDVKDFIRHKCTSPIYEVRTRTGRRIKVTGYHSLFTLNGNRVEEVKTSDLKPKESYIAIPSRIAFSPSPPKTLDFISALRENGFGLYVKDVQPQLSEAIGKLGEEKACAILGMKGKNRLNEYVRRNIGIKPAKFLSLMEEAAVSFDPEKISISAGKKKLPGKIRLTTDLAFFLGLWIAEGSYNRQDTVRISTSEKELPVVEALCRKLFGSITVYSKKNSKGRDIYIPSRVLYVFMRHFLSLEHGADKKKVPQLAFSFSKENLSAFLRGYFSGDGSVYLNQKGFGTVEASTASEGLAGELLYLLLYFGIVGTVYEKKERTGTLQRRICLAGEPLRRFSEHIGFAFAEKQERLAKCSSLGGWHRGPQIPISGALRGFVAQNMPDYCKCGTIGRDILQRFDSDDEFCEILQNDIYWDCVEEITRIKDEEYVYDISVEPCQNFAGGFGGIFAHNSEKNVAEIFSIARQKAPCVLFFDEIDSIGKKRDSYTSDDVAPRVMSVLLEELDGFKGKSNVIAIGATNMPDQLDPALIRPGRFDKIIYMHLPDAEARKSIFKVHLKKLPIDKDMDYGKLAAMTERYSGADIKNICTEASRLAAREAMGSNTVVNVSIEHLKATIKKLKPSVTLDQIELYNKFRMDYERRSDAEEKKPESKGVRWEDVAGLDEVRKVLLEAIEIPLLHEDLMKEMDVKPSKGLLLFGPPGCGKTMIVKAAANELNANFLTISGSELMKGREKSPSAYVKEVFNRARESPPALIFIDEIEALAPSREMYTGGILTELLQELDGVKELKNVMLIGATNKPSSLDSAILRPGRFDKIIYIPPPDMPAREKIFTTSLSKFLKDVDVERLSRATDGFSGADVSSICQNVKMQAVRDRLAGKPLKLDTASVLSVISTRRPSVTAKDLKEYFSFMQEYGERK